MKAVQIITDPTHHLHRQELFEALRMPGAQTLELGAWEEPRFWGLG